MPIIASAKSDGNFLPCPAGVHDALCVFVEDLGMEYSEQYKKDNHKIIICWEINEPMSDGRPYMLSQRYTLSLNEKATLRKMLEGWRGKKFTDQELTDGFDLEKLKGKQCQIQVIHNEKNGKTYANIGAVLPKGKNSIAMTAVNTELPDWIAKVKEENAAAHAKLDHAPVVIVDAVKPAAGGAPPADDEPPFACDKLTWN